jgi:hypothetical protein
MKIAMLYAYWEGEGWSTPIGIQNEFEARGFEVRKYNLYHNEGNILPQKKIRTYSAEGLNKLNYDVRNNKYKPDIVLIMDYTGFDAPHLDKIHFPGLWLMEAGDEPQSHRMQSMRAHKFHGILSPDFECTQRYKQAGMDALWWTHHADLEIFHDGYDIKPIFDCVTTCGSRGKGSIEGKSLTDEISEALGERFNNNRYFFGEEHAKRLCMGKIVFQCSQYGEITRRIFEGMACGRMVLADRLSTSTNIDTLFEDGVDLVYYNDSKDAIDKIRYYSEHDEEREKIAHNGLMKAGVMHSQVARVNELLRFAQEVAPKHGIVLPPVSMTERELVSSKCPFPPEEGYDD